MTDLLLGIDVGTNSTKGVLVRADGSVVAEEAIRHEPTVPAPGLLEMDADTVWWSDLETIARALGAAIGPGDRLAGAAISAMTPCLVAVGDDGLALRPAILYGADTRSAGQVEALERRHGREALATLGGSPLSTQSLGPKIMWLRENEPDVYARTRRFLTAASYLVFRLTGVEAIDRHTASHAGPLVDIGRMAWSDRFADGIVDLERLPPIRSMHEIAGWVTAAAARETGIPAGTPVLVGNADTMAEAVSVGVTEPGDAVLMVGTSGFLFAVTDERRAGAGLWTTGGAFRDRFGLSGGISTAGGITTWFRDVLGADLLAAEEGGGPDAYVALSELATTSPLGANGLLALPFLSGERRPGGDARRRGLVAGLSLATGRADLYRAMLEGVAFGLRQTLDRLRASAPVERLVGVGGGLATPLWRGIITDVLDHPILITERHLGARLGDAFLAGLAVGAVAEGDLASGWVSIAESLEPDPAAAAAYAQRYGAFTDLDAAMAGWETPSR